jgi:hypothetical protein
MSKNQAPENVRQLFDDYCAHQKEKLEEELQDLLDLLKICESPLEQCYSLNLQRCLMLDRVALLKNAISAVF